jgi:hypothetical protein
MTNTDEPRELEPSVLDTAKIDYIDSEELTDTAALPEPLSAKIADKIADVLEDASAAIANHSDKD